MYLRVLLWVLPVFLVVGVLTLHHPASHSLPSNLVLPNIAPTDIAHPTTTTSTTSTTLAHQAPPRATRGTVRTRIVQPTTPTVITPPPASGGYGPGCMDPSTWNGRLHSSAELTASAHRCWDYLIAQHPWSASTAFRIMMCESHGNPYAANASGARGLMQILSKDKYGNYTGSFDPQTNMDQAWAKYQAAHGWSPWVCQ